MVELVTVKARCGWCLPCRHPGRREYGLSVGLLLDFSMTCPGLYKIPETQDPEEAS